MNDEKSAPMPSREFDHSTTRRITVLFRGGQSVRFYATPDVATQIAADIRDERRIGEYHGWPEATHGSYISSSPPSPIVISLPDVLCLT